jgi:uncharacterized membrane protein
MAHPIHVRGWTWMNNDVVNFLGTLTGSLIGLLAYPYSLTH